MGIKVRKSVAEGNLLCLWEKALNFDKDQQSFCMLNLATGLLLIVVALFYLSTTLADVDLWGYLAFGRLFWNSGQFPYQDIFSYLPTLDPWVYHEWLTGVIFYLIYQLVGLTGLQIIKYLLGLFTLGLVYLTARNRGAQPSAAVLILLIVLMSGWISFGYSPVRAQVFTYFFFVLTLYLLERARIRSNYSCLWLLVPIIIVWCNVHGGFLAGLGLIGLYMFGEFISRRTFLPYLIVLFFSGLATLINPYTIEYWKYIIIAVTMPRPQIWEWNSIYECYRSGLISMGNILSLVSIIVFSIIMMWRNRWINITSTLILAATLFIAMLHIRHMVFFALILSVYLPELIKYYYEDLKSKPKVMAILGWIGIKNSILVILLFVFIFGYLFIKRSPFSMSIPSSPESVSGIERYYPVKAVHYIRKNQLSGKLLTEFGWGEYLIWSLYPHCRVGLDGRYETVYPEKVTKQYFDFMSLQNNYRQFLNKYPPDMILLRTGSPVFKLLKDDHQWLKVYSDSGCGLFLRQNDKCRVEHGGVHVRALGLCCNRPNSTDAVKTYFFFHETAPRRSGLEN